MSDLPEGWDSYNPDEHERSEAPAYKVARAAAATRAERRRAAYGEALGALRRARSLTQVVLAERLGIAQGEVSRIEHQADLLLSTLARYVDGLDGQLHLLVRFGDTEEIELSAVLDDLLDLERIDEESSASDPATVIELAGYIGRYHLLEERFRAVATA
ncbi:MAG: XRE family transcriptional regulator [Actinomycetota bacterium]|nr:XRE family transcriptional regulator [Actinomycetota bacterium]MDA8356089.1 XRE family transcriptional regulator [Actinomycetota bacterium]